MVYIFATTGVMLFGGLVYDGNKDLDSTDYRDGNMEILNFNDLGLAMVSLFTNLVTSFVPEFYEAFTTVAPYPWLAVVYWVSFYIAGVMVVFNVFASFIIDLFLAVYEDGIQEETEGVAEARAEAEQGYVTIGKFQGADALYKKMFLEDADDEGEEGVEKIQKVLVECHAEKSTNQMMERMAKGKK